jgi:hypothetical protein
MARAVFLDRLQIAQHRAQRVARAGHGTLGNLARMKAGDACAVVQAPRRLRVATFAAAGGAVGHVGDDNARNIARTDHRAAPATP